MDITITGYIVRIDDVTRSRATVTAVEPLKVTASERHIIAEGERAILSHHAPAWARFYGARRNAVVMPEAPEIGERIWLR